MIAPKLAVEFDRMQMEIARQRNRLGEEPVVGHQLVHLGKVDIPQCLDQLAACFDELEEGAPSMMSMIGFADRPGTDVLPMCSICTRNGASAVSKARRSSSNCFGHSVE